MKINSIKTEEEYKLALKRLDEIFDAKTGTKEGEELVILGVLIEEYENSNSS